MTTTNNEPLGGEKIEQIRALLSEAYSFKSTSPVAQQNINAALDLLDELESSQQAGAAGADEVLPELPRPAITYADHSYPAYSKKQMKEYARLSVANLARQQAPVGDSVDTPEFRNLLAACADDIRSKDKWVPVFTYITAWKDAQLARERQGANFEDDPVGAFQAEARQAKLDDFIASTRSAQAQGEPVARDPDLKTWPARIWLQHQFEYTPAFEVAYKACGEITWCQDSVDRYDIEYVRADLAGPAPQADECRLLCEKLGIKIGELTPMTAIACHIADLKYAINNAAPQADEIRDGARLNWMAQNGAQLRSDPKDSRWYLVMPYHTGISCADDHLRFDTPREAIDAAMRTTAADNQTKGE